MQPGTAGGGYVSHSRCQKLIIKRALKLSLAAAVFSAFLCLPLAVGWVNCSDSGAIVRCERAMEARGPPRTGGAWHGGAACPGTTAGERRAGPGTGRALLQHRGGLGTVPAHPTASSGPSLPIRCLRRGISPRGLLETAWKWPFLWAARPRVSLLPAMGKVSVQMWVMCPADGARLAQTPPLLDHLPPTPLRSHLVPGRGNAGASKGSRCPVL